MSAEKRRSQTEKLGHSAEKRRSQTAATENVVAIFGSHQ